MYYVLDPTRKRKPRRGPYPQRKFQVGDRVALIKTTRYRPYRALQGIPGAVVRYQLRVYRGGVAGSKYQVDFDGIGLRWVETEYLGKLEYAYRRALIPIPESRSDKV